MRCLLLILALVPAAAFAQPQEYYGAIAYTVTGKAYGWASDHPTREAAEKAALAHCRKFAEDCRVAVWFRNACAALAIGPKGDYGSAWGETQEATDKEALKLCAKYSKGCVVRHRVCTAGKGPAKKR